MSSHHADSVVTQGLRRDKHCGLIQPFPRAVAAKTINGIAVVATLGMPPPVVMLLVPETLLPANSKGAGVHAIKGCGIIGPVAVDVGVGRNLTPNPAGTGCSHPGSDFFRMGTDHGRNSTAPTFCSLVHKDTVGALRILNQLIPGQAGQFPTTQTGPTTEIDQILVLFFRKVIVTCLGASAPGDSHPGAGWSSYIEIRTAATVQFSQSGDLHFYRGGRQAFVDLRLYPCRCVWFCGYQGSASIDLLGPFHKKSRRV